MIRTNGWWKLDLIESDMYDRDDVNVSRVYVNGYGIF